MCALDRSNSTGTFNDGQWHTVSFRTHRSCRACTSVVQSPPVGSNLCDGQGHVVLFEQASNTFYVTMDKVHTVAITAAIVSLLRQSTMRDSQHVEQIWHCNPLQHVSYPLLNGTSVQVEVAASQFVRFEVCSGDPVQPSSACD